MIRDDPIMSGFLEQQYVEGMALDRDSDILDLAPLGEPPTVAAYLAQFRCTGLVRRDGQIVEHGEHLIGIRFPDDYLKRFDTARVLSWIEPHDPWHANVRFPFICAGAMQPGTPLVDLLYQVFEIITWQNLETREFNALNSDACKWARRNHDRFPLDNRPLKRRQASAKGQPETDTSIR